MLVSQFPLTSQQIAFQSDSQWDAPFYYIAYDYPCADWDDFHDHSRDVPWENIFKLGASASEFCEWVQVMELMDISLIANIRCQAQLFSMVFSCLCSCYSL